MDEGERVFGLSNGTADLPKSSLLRLVPGRDKFVVKPAVSAPGASEKSEVQRNFIKYAGKNTKCKYLL